MKVDAQTLSAMESDMEAVFADAYTPSERRKMLVMDTDVRIAWRLWHRVTDDRRWNDAHPLFAHGYRKRVLPYVGLDFPIYPCGTNDKTLETALLKAWRRIKERWYEPPC